ncbi:accessory Sec-dependent serine-rich glycoprotein adhesin, partial [Streptococcus uberis]
MSKKQIGSDYVQTDSKSRVKLHKSGKSWVKTTLTSMGLLHLFRGAKTEERVLDTDLDLEAGFSSTHWFKGAAALGALVGGAAVTNTAYAAETTSTLPVTSEVTTTGTTQVDSTVVASASVSDTTSASASTSASTSQSVSESQSLLASASMSQSESLSTSQSTSTSTASTSGTSTVSTSTSSSQSTSTSDSTVLAPKASTLTSSNLAATTSGLAINEAITNVTLTQKDMGVYDGSGNILASSIGDGVVKPLDAEYLAIDTTFDIVDAATAGDQFTVQLSDTIKTNDLAPTGEVYSPVDITDPSGEVIATGTYDPSTNIITYTLTDYVDKYENVKAVIHLEKFVNRDVVQDNTTSVPVTVSVGNTVSTEYYAVEYTTPIQYGSAEIMSSFASHDQVNGTVEQVIYVNQDNYLMDSPYVTITTVDSTAINTLDSTSTIEVYRVPAGFNLPDSMEILDYSSFTRVPVTIDYSSPNTVTFDLNAAPGYDSSTYVIRAISQYDPTVPDASLYQAAKVYSGLDQATYENFIKYYSDTSGGIGTLTYKIGNYVWVDTNNDGIQNEGGTTGLADVLVTLTFPDGSTKAVRTDANGYYEFAGLTDGETYTISFETPAGYTPAIANAGTDDTIDSDGSSVTVTINGADNMTLDTGFVADVVKEVHTIGDTVWEDTNKDGIQDVGEPGIPGVTVTLTNPDGTTVTTTTDTNGHYEFTDLLNGDYTVTFETPAGYLPTTTDTGDDSLDSDGQVVKVTVAGSDNPTIDSGFVKEVYTIGDTVWEDTNKDGIQDAGEPGIPGVTVTLTNPDGTTVTTTTDADGYYEFTGLNDGDTYTVTFETPAGYVPTTANVGDDSLDSDGSSV